MIIENVERDEYTTPYGVGQRCFILFFYKPEIPPGFKSGQTHLK
jgi:hypothetical protein